MFISIALEVLVGVLVVLAALPFAICRRTALLFARRLLEVTLPGVALLTVWFHLRPQDVPQALNARLQPLLDDLRADHPWFRLLESFFGSAWLPFGAALVLCGLLKIVLLKELVKRLDTPASAPDTNSAEAGIMEDGVTSSTLKTPRRVKDLLY